MKTEFVLVLAIAVLILAGIPAFGQTTAEEWFDKGVNLSNQSRYNEAMKAFDKAIELNPQSAEAWAGRGFSLNGQIKYYEALQAYDKATQLDPKLAEAWVGKGFAILSLSDNPFESFDAFDQAISLDPNYGIAWIGELVAEDYLGSMDLALKAGQLNPKYAADLFTDYGETLSFQRKVFLNEGRPRTSEATRLNAALLPPTVPQKTVAERFTELNKIKKSATKQI